MPPLGTLLSPKGLRVAGVAPLPPEVQAVILAAQPRTSSDRQAARAEQMRDGIAAWREAARSAEKEVAQ